MDNYFPRRQWSSVEFATAVGGVRLRTMQTLSAFVSVEDLACRPALDQPLSRLLEHRGPRTCVPAASRTLLFCSSTGGRRSAAVVIHGSRRLLQSERHEQRRQFPNRRHRGCRPGASPKPQTTDFAPGRRARVGVLATLYFWVWWLQPKHNIGTVWFVLNSIALGWATLIPLYLLSLYIRGRVSGGQVAPPGGRVAMVVTKAPSEPWIVVRQTLEAMLAQDYPHDTWLADEDPACETIAWCKAHGVRVSTRKGVAAYHRTTWPRRTRCKEGNLAYFYDHYGYDLYDFVVQMDADHVPSCGYLREMLKPFSNPLVGYVSAPSICDKNAAKNWSARGRLYVEATVHGLLQAAYSNGWAPLCIGSHYAVRTRALREIGGLGPELAEDHSTTLMMNAHGWRGVHAFNAIAHGDGPSTFRDLITQEFQWSRSLMTIFLQHTGTHISPPAAHVEISVRVLSALVFAFFVLHATYVCHSCYRPGYRPPVHERHAGRFHYAFPACRDYHCFLSLAMEGEWLVSPHGCEAVQLGSRALSARPVALDPGGYCGGSLGSR